MVLEHLGIDPARFTYEWVSAAEGIRFADVITEFGNRIRSLGPLGQKEKAGPGAFRYKLKAAEMTVEGRLFRTAFAKQAKQILGDGSFGKFPDKDKLAEVMSRETAMNEALLYLNENDRSAGELAELLCVPVEQAVGYVEMLKKKKLWDGELIGT